MSGKTSMARAAALMAARLRVFRAIAQSARDTQSHVDLAPEELWEPADEAALAAYEEAINEINGARPLFQEISA